MAAKSNMERLEAIVAELPEAERVDIEEWNLPARSSAARWTEVREWVRTSYTLVAPKTLARLVIAEDDPG